MLKIIFIIFLTFQVGFIFEAPNKEKTKENASVKKERKEIVKGYIVFDNNTYKKCVEEKDINFCNKVILKLEGSFKEFSVYDYIDNHISSEKIIMLTNFLSIACENSQGDDKIRACAWKSSVATAIAGRVLFFKEVKNSFQEQEKGYDTYKDLYDNYSYYLTDHKEIFKSVDNLNIACIKENWSLNYRSYFCRDMAEAIQVGFSIIENYLKEDPNRYIDENNMNILNNNITVHRNICDLFKESYRKKLASFAAYFRVCSPFLEFDLRMSYWRLEFINSINIGYIKLKNSGRNFDDSSNENLDKSSFELSDQLKDLLILEDR